MVPTFSPHRDGGGTLHFPSPTHIHHADPSSALAQLRRSLSRSPSKPPTFRIIASKPNSPIPTSPLSPSPASPRRDDVYGIPFPLSTRKCRSTTRRRSPAPPLSRSLSLQRSPAKRALSDCSDTGNATPSPPSMIVSGEEDNPVTGAKPAPPKFLAPADALGPDSHSADHVPNRIFSRRDRANYLGDASVKSSPLKRSDANNNRDLNRGGSPSAKRRSLHGGSFGTDFDIFDQNATATATVADELNAASEQVPTPFASPMARRTGSLRKTALHQRHDKPLFKGRLGFEPTGDAYTPIAPRNRMRMSLDNFPQPSRESPFSSQGSLPNASAHPMPTHRKEGSAGTAPSLALGPRHPLSRTMTQSSSGSSFVEDSPTTLSLQQYEARQASLDFARSLPLHASRPAPIPPPVVEALPSSQETRFATPESYRDAKPLQQAFMSTGLISKCTKNIDHGPLNARESIGHMPDTPCKRPFSVATMSPAKPVARVGPTKQARHTLHSFGTPSTPFNPHASQSAVFGPGSAVFGSNFNRGPSARRTSFLAADIPSPARGEVPPTPTKHVGPMEPALPLDVQFDAKPVLNVGAPVEADANNGFNKSVFESSSDEDNDGAEPWDLTMSPSARVRPQSICTTRVDDERRQRLSLQSPTPHSKSFNTVPFSRRRSIKPQPLPAEASGPAFEQPQLQIPATPAEMLPPDPSRLSISNAQSQGLTASNTGAFSFFFPPATPTANRDSFNRTSHKASLTPIQQMQAAQVDESITSRFDKVELIGLGEFSSVFRGIQLHGSANRAGAVGREQVSDKAPSRSWAVKKTRNAYLGQRDRNQKLKEVDVLRVLGVSEHTIEFVDCWEFGQHLYIQTEYCEEGGLDVFLEKVGRQSRLDDFRIWKILLELSLGLKHIHDSGIIHLDLKPANVLITFEGVLKIGDFGMASFWPAAAGIEGEGDREYIAPEILRGGFDKPADVFALGLIMLEIAANVMLPDNGVSWQRLRSGDMSDVPSLTSDSSSSVATQHSVAASLDPSIDSTASLGDPAVWLDDALTPTQTQRNARAGELLAPPAFMARADDEQALDALVRWMIAPEPKDRPRAEDLLATAGVSWVQVRRRAGATIYEGQWGPADGVLEDDAEMIDV